jgi:translation elongation factor EF-1alpha
LKTEKKGESQLAKPKSVGSSSAAVVEVGIGQESIFSGNGLLAKSFAVIEPFKDFPPLGRFVLRGSGMTVAVGVCTQILS